MTLASVLAIVDGRAGSEAVIKAALAIGKDFACSVELLHVETKAEEAIPMIGENVSGAVIEQVIQSIESDVKQRVAEANRLFASHCVAAGLPVADTTAEQVGGRFTVRFKHVVGHEPDEVARRGLLSDMVLVARPASDAEAPDARTLEAAMFETGRPVIMVPPHDRDSLGEKIALAWNGRREAARAVAAALPFLTKARRVVVLTARRDDKDAKPSELAHYLSLHGIKAETWAFTPKQDPIGTELLIQAAEAGADLLVMGAYGHSRLREFILGGATRRVVAEAAIPVLMAH